MNPSNDLRGLKWAASAAPCFPPGPSAQDIPRLEAPSLASPTATNAATGDDPTPDRPPRHLAGGSGARPAPPVSSRRDHRRPVGPPGPRGRSTRRSCRRPRIATRFMPTRPRPPRSTSGPGSTRPRTRRSGSPATGSGTPGQGLRLGDGDVPEPAPRPVLGQRLLEARRQGVVSGARLLERPADRPDRLEEERPADDRPEEDVTASPGADHFYIPGHYAPDGDGVTWKKGYWAKSQPGWSWVPAQWVRQPEGWNFQEGYWDRTLEDRGTLFAPVQGAANSNGTTEVTYTPLSQIAPEQYGQLYGAFGRPNSNYDGYPGCYYDSTGRYYGYANYGNIGSYYGYLDYPYTGSYGYPYLAQPVAFNNYGYGVSGYGGYGGGSGVTAAMGVAMAATAMAWVATAAMGPAGTAASAAADSAGGMVASAGTAGRSMERPLRQLVLRWRLHPTMEGLGFYPGYYGGGFGGYGLGYGGFGGVRGPGRFGVASAGSASGGSGSVGSACGLRLRWPGVRAWWLRRLWRLRCMETVCVQPRLQPGVPSGHRRRPPRHLPEQPGPSPGSGR